MKNDYRSAILRGRERDMSKSGRRDENSCQKQFFKFLMAGYGYNYSLNPCLTNLSPRYAPFVITPRAVSA